MRRAAIITLTAILAAGCGSTRHVTGTTTTAKPKPASARLIVGVVGPLTLNVPGAAAERGTLAQVSRNPLVLVDASVDDAERVAAAAARNPSSHFALVGASTKGFHRPNLVGLVLREEQAARLAGVIAGFVAADQGANARVAWVGPQELALAGAYADGVHESLPSAGVLYAWSKRIPARCKEAALAAIARGAMVVTAHKGLCAAASAVASHQQNHVALSVTDFELPGVPAAIVTRDALAGVYHGGEDLVFGATSGAIGVRRLDPRISVANALRARTAAQQLASGLRPSG